MSNVETTLINCSLLYGVVSDRWKLAVVMSILKKDVQFLSVYLKLLYLTIFIDKTSSVKIQYTQDLLQMSLKHL